MTQEFDQFQAWLMEMDDAIATYRRSLPKSLADKLDFSPDSLGVMEAHVLATYENVSQAKASTEAKRLDAMARYVGETFRKHFGGKWKIDYSDKKNAFYGLPQLAGMKSQDVQFCPLTLVTASTQRRTGTFFRKIFDNYVRDAS